MKKVDKKLNRSQIVTICVASAALLLLIACITVSIIVSNLGSDSTVSNETTDIMTELGESMYLNQCVAYEPIEEAEITAILVDNSNGRFSLTRAPDELGSFILSYFKDGEEQETVVYQPDIYTNDPAFDYESLYAIETNDSYGRIYLLTYLCSAIGTPYFKERIELPSDQEQRDAYMRAYGLTQNEVSTVSFNYSRRDANGNTVRDENGNLVEETCSIIIGNQAVSGQGYYFMVIDGNEDRKNYVYYTGGTYFKYALLGFHEFVKGTLVSEGVDEDSLYGPYLTTDFKEWVGTVYKEEGDQLTEELVKNAEVVTNANVYVPIDKGITHEPDSDGADGYTKLSDELVIDLIKLYKSDDQADDGALKNYERIKNALMNSTNGSGKDILLTFIEKFYSDGEKTVELGDSTEIKYIYTISAIESVVNTAEEKTEGSVALSDDYVKVTYRYTLGTETCKHDCHALIKMSDLVKMGKETLFVGKTIGTLDEPITLEIDYSENNALIHSQQTVVTSIVSIYDQNGVEQTKIDSNSDVYIYCYRVVNGVKSNMISLPVRMSETINEEYAQIQKAILGLSVGSCDITAYEEDVLYEYMRPFTAYRINEIKQFTANEIKASFKFSNASERDPFYGETFFETTLEDSNKLYALNSGACEGVVKFLGGIGVDSSSAVGLSGTTVCVGLTTENMNKYGVYANRIYFELPREIEEKTSDSSTGTDDDGTVDADELSDYIWAYTLGFTLYISDETYNENNEKVRYVASDMYDLIAEISAEGFEFLDLEFTEFWARKNLINVAVEDIEVFKLDFNMTNSDGSDMKGSYKFELNFTERYYGYNDKGQYQSSIDKDYFDQDGYTYTGTGTHQVVYASASSDAFDTELKDYLGSNKSVDLTAFYNNDYVYGSEISVGVNTFNEALQVVQFTRYQGALEESEKVYDESGESFDESRYIFQMSIKVNDGSNYYYTYRFYRVDDRRIMVSLYRSIVDPITGENVKVASMDGVSDFYVSTFAFKQIVNSFVMLLNGEEFSEAPGYPEQ